jgi:hypothetical protein
MMPSTPTGCMNQETTMDYETLARHTGFALAALGAVVVLAFTVQALPGLVR